MMMVSRFQFDNGQSATESHGQGSRNLHNEDYLIDFPGFYEAFSASLNVPDIGSFQATFINAGIPTIF